LKEFALTLHPEKTRLIEFGDTVSETHWVGHSAVSISCAMYDAL
jgi:hypothetical protein